MAFAEDAELVVFGVGEDAPRLAALTALPSVTDRRSFSGSTTTQVEPLTLNVLATIVREAVEVRRDMDVLWQAIAREPTERQAFIDRLNNRT
ncbi:hypothetical protein [Streptomyces sp. NPDC002676]